MAIFKPHDVSFSVRRQRRSALTRVVRRLDRPQLATGLRSEYIGHIEFEVVQSNSHREMDAKTAAYLAAGALEVWIVYPQWKRIEAFTSLRKIDQSQYKIELDRLFD